MTFTLTLTLTWVTQIAHIKQIMNIIERLRDFIENEMRPCSMDIGGITPQYVYRMWGEEVALNEIESVMPIVKSQLI